MTDPKFQVDTKRQEIFIDWEFLTAQLVALEKEWSITFQDEGGTRQTFSLSPNFWEKPTKLKEIVNILFPQHNKSKKDELITLFSKSFSEMVKQHCNFDEFKQACAKMNPTEEVEEEDTKFIETCTGEVPPIRFEVFRTPDEKTNFVCYNTKTGEIQYKNSVVNGTRIYNAPERIPFEPINPVGINPQNKQNLNALYLDIRKFVFDNCDFYESWAYDVIAHWVMATWFYEKFETFPYLMFMGPQGCGKTRALEILTALAYHAYKSSSASESALAHDIEEKHVTMLLDEAEFLFKTRQEIFPILNSGYKKGDYYSRRDENNAKTIYMNLFGPKAIASRSKLPSPVMEKCILFKMTKNRRDISRVTSKSEAGELRKRLLEARLSLIGDIMPSEFINTNIGGLEIKNIKDFRLYELARPLYLMSLMASTSPYLEEWVTSAQTAKAEETAQRDEALILSAVVDYLKGIEGLTFPIVLNSTDIAALMNQDIITKDEQTQARYVGKIISSLGFESKRKKNKRLYNIEQERILMECKNYNIEVPESWKEIYVFTRKIKIVADVIQHISKSNNKQIGPFIPGDEITLIMADADRLIKLKMAEPID